MTSDVKEYRQLPYTKVVRKAEEEGITEFVAYIEEIPWIRVNADEREEAYLLLDETFEDALRAMLDAGDEIPVPEGTLERFGEPSARQSEAHASRWSTSRVPDAIGYEPTEESEAWASGSQDPEPELESSAA
ncbi:MAG TPA: hypothetical protein VM198_05015 [Longimicrobiales bacterium]|nr:hypothetical protein [Longimicrobiales bacterium]